MPDWMLFKNRKTSITYINSDTVIVYYLKAFSLDTLTMADSIKLIIGIRVALFIHVNIIIWFFVYIKFILKIYNKLKWTVDLLNEHWGFHVVSVGIYFGLVK